MKTRIIANTLLTLKRSGITLLTSYMWSLKKDVSVLKKAQVFSIWEHSNIQVLYIEQLDGLSIMPKSLWIQYLLHFYTQGVVV